MFNNLYKLLKNSSLKESNLLDLLIKIAGYDDEWREKIETHYSENKKPFSEYLNNEDRLYIPMPKSSDNVEPPVELLDLLEEINLFIPSVKLEFKSYKSGLINVNDKPIKFIKFIQKIPYLYKQNGGDESNLDKINSLINEIKSIFISDPNRQLKSDQKLLVVISQNPHDIAKMSYERGWESCMTLGKGEFYQNLFCEVESGGLVAYLIRDNDKNIENPISRIHIRRFENNFGVSIAVPEGIVYGTSNDEFQRIVRDFAKRVNEDKIAGRYNLKGGAHSDTYLNKFSLMDDEDVDKIISDFENYNDKDRDFNDPRFKNIVLKLRDLVFNNPMGIIDRENSIKLETKMEAISTSPSIMTLFKNQTEDMCNHVLDLDGSFIKYIKNPTFEMCKRAIDEDISNINDIKRPSADVMRYAISINEDAIFHLVDHGLKVPIDIIMYAIEKWPENERAIKAGFKI